MKMITLLLVCPALTAMAAGPAERDLTFRSTSKRGHLLELFTSEGCSSCPPAEKWMSQLKQSPRLWREIVPVAFHVDYWDGLGWPDRFASKAFTARQRSYAASWASRTVYTPGFVLDGREWQDRAEDRIPPLSGDAGVLSAVIRGRKTITVTYQADRAGRFEAHVALLGFGLSSNVKAGENSGRKLLHDFVALAHETKAMSMDAGSSRAEISFPALNTGGELGLAVWVTEAGKPQPLQAVGGKL
ncbi:MAG: DUF1223 domain-containing protein [Verrucomicrobiota bacterium]|nr:DUF1223 domain-containing protein [Verrucomicrobiota bacterium]